MVPRRRAALRAYSWVRRASFFAPADFSLTSSFKQIAKGLVVRSDQRGYAMVDRLLDLLQDRDVATVASSSLGTIAEEKDGVLSRENASVIRVRAAR